MKKVIQTYKPRGLTPLQLIQVFKKKHPGYQDKKIAYAGRLDPMARGVLLLLIEPETKKRHKYQNLDKEYIFEVLFGVKTDTYDLLGIIPNEILRQAQDDGVGSKSIPTLSTKKINNAINSFVGRQEHSFPPFSSKTVEGKPLFWWAREGKLGEIEVPRKEIEIYNIQLIRFYTLNMKQLRDQVIKRLSLVKGNFRQKQILGSWKRFFQTTKQQKFQIAKIKIHCSSGTYVRLLAHKLGQKLGPGAIVLDILRTRVGKYKLENAIRI